jgi:signal transduction histidine kinase
MIGSVRARLTVAAALVVGGVATTAAVIAPRVVRSALEDDRLDAEVVDEVETLDTELFVPGATNAIGPAELTAFFGPEVADLVRRLAPSGALDELRNFRADRSIHVTPVSGVVALVDDAGHVRVEFSDGDTPGPIVTSTRLQMLADELNPSTLSSILDMFADGPISFDEFAADLSRQFGDQFADQLDPSAFDGTSIFDLQGQIPPGVFEALQRQLLPSLDELVASSQANVPDVDDMIFGVRRVGNVDVVVSASSNGIDGSVRRVRQAVWFAVPFSMLLAGGLAWLLAGRALRPVRSITERTRLIRSSTLHERVPVPAARDEVADLATEVNTMLARVQREDERRRQFVADASHELRSPLAAIRAQAEAALHPIDQPPVTELATGVLAEAERMSTLVDDLLSLARHEEDVTPPGQILDLDDIVLAEASRSRRLPIDTKGVSAGRVRGHRDEVTRVVTHLLDNAARHGRSVVQVSLHTEVGTVRLRIDDDGPGVPEHERERIFERFVRLDEARQRDEGGAGLGLAVVQTVVAASGGTISVTDSPLGGARFQVDLPEAD